MKKDITDELLDAIQYMIDKSIKNANFDRTRFGKITASYGNNLYDVEIAGKIYERVRALGSTNYEINKIVPIVVPVNEASNMFISYQN